MALRPKLQNANLGFFTKQNGSRSFFEIDGLYNNNKFALSGDNDIINNCIFEN